MGFAAMAGLTSVNTSAPAGHADDLVDDHAMGLAPTPAARTPAGPFKVVCGSGAGDDDDDDDGAVALVLGESAANGVETPTTAGAGTSMAADSPGGGSQYSFTPSAAAAANAFASAGGFTPTAAVGSSLRDDVKSGPATPTSLDGAGAKAAADGQESPSNAARTPTSATGRASPSKRRLTRDRTSPTKRGMFQRLKLAHQQSLRSLLLSHGAVAATAGTHPFALKGKRGTPVNETARAQSPAHGDGPPSAPNVTEAEGATHSPGPGSGGESPVVAATRRATAPVIRRTDVENAADGRLPPSVAYVSGRCLCRRCIGTSLTPCPTLQVHR